MQTETNINAVVFAGGGCRCLWQVGFWEVASQLLEIQPKIVTAVSAGAAVACMIFAGRSPQGIACFKQLMRANRRNLHLENLFSSRPVLRHYEIFRRLIAQTLDEPAMQVLRQGPPVRILVSRPPGWLGPQSATCLGLLIYSMEKGITYPVHPKLATQIGFKADISLANDCRSPEELATLILATSCAPPIVPVITWKNRIALDGGLIDNVPVNALPPDLPPGQTLILLTRRYTPQAIPRVPGRLYVQPSRQIPIQRWDYASPHKLQEAVDLGRQDALAFGRWYATQLKSGQLAHAHFYGCD